MCFLSHLVATVGKPAPDWNGTAVFNGDFQELKLADFKGKEVQCCPWILHKVCHCCFSTAGKYLVFFFYPLDL